MISALLKEPGHEQPARAVNLVICEDNRADVLLVEAALKLHNIVASVRVLADGEKAIQHLDAVDSDPAEPCPTLVLLDLNLPRRNGAEILRRLRASPRCGQIPVIVMTSSDSRRERAEMDLLGIAHYFIKPTNYHGFMKVGEVIQRVLNESNSSN